MKKFFLILGIVVLSLFGISVFTEFMANHTYYNDMLASRDNWKLIIWAVIACSIPLYYVTKAKVFSLKKFFVWILPAALLLFSVAHTMIKEGIVGGSAGFIILCINSLLLYFLWMYFILGIFAFGSRISQKIIAFKEHRWQEMIINFGIGLGIFLLFLSTLAMVHLFYGVIMWILFLGLGGMIWYMKSYLLETALPLFTNLFSNFSLNAVKQHRRRWVILILFAFSIMYYLYGFQLSFIPYSTAWDANHEYMYVPKVLAENAGVLRGNVWPLSSLPYLRHMFIAFWFGLITPIKSRFWLAPDTIAVAMNFLSGVFVMIFWLGLIDEVLNFFAKKQENLTTKGLSFAFGWTGLLFWLTSGMGAFLVFVDNKTDLWVLAMTALALLSGFIVIKMLSHYPPQGKSLSREVLKYVVTSGFLFSLASMAKPTAFIDIALFGVLLTALWIDEVVALGIGIVLAGTTGIMWMANAPDMISPFLGRIIALIGIIIIALGILRLFSHYGKKFWENKRAYVSYILIWILACFWSLLIFKGPTIVITTLHTNSLSVGNFAKGILLSTDSADAPLLASTTTGSIQQQAQQDQIILQTQTQSTDLASCKTQKFSSGDLYTGMKAALMTNEDIGRYVGYGWKEFDRKGRSVGYYLMRIFFPLNDTCYGANHDAKLLCEQAGAIDSFDVATLQKLMNEVSTDGKAYPLLSAALNAYELKAKTLSWAFNPTEFRDQIVALRQYYQDHSIATSAGKLFIPYRYLTPVNIIFNWSLQNLSSYYTDIGFVRLFMLVFVVFGVIYALIKKDKHLTILSGVTVLWWSIRWIIGGGILWYGIGLTVWTILTVALFMQAFLDASDEHESYSSLLYTFLVLFALWASVQMMFNFIRISSQWAGWPFMWYKMGNGKSVEVTDQLQQQETVKSKYGRKDVFDLQFPHYNGFIDYVANRKDSDGVLIAGTYMQYFLKNQRNLQMDGMLNRFWKETSDGNLCKSYQRLQHDNIKYLVIDPNIWTVGMGEGNESLFNRFFAKRDAVSGKIQEDGAISRLVKLRKAGYIWLFSTNNIGAKYAFSLDDATLEASFGQLSADDLILLRAKLSIARFFPDAQQLLTFIATTFTQRITNGKALGDIADIYGKTIQEDKLLAIAQQLQAQKDPEQSKAAIQALSQDERLILVQYLGLVQLQTAQNPQLQEYTNSLLQQSLGGGSQLIVFALN